MVMIAMTKTPTAKQTMSKIVMVMNNNNDNDVYAFWADDELSTCRAYLASPEQSILSIS